MSHFKRIDGDGMQLFAGNYRHVTQMPRYYVPVWIAVTTPLVYTGFFITGFLFILYRLVKSNRKIYRNSRERFDLLMLALLAGPLLAVIVLHSVVYDGWRHLYYIYPCFIVIALIGLVSLVDLCKGWLETNKARLLTAGLYLVLLTGMAYTAYFMIKYHPQQQVYFNVLAGSPVFDRFEQDYYGVSYKQGLEYIVIHDRLEAIKIYVNYLSGETNSSLLPLKDRQRIRYEPDSTKADYFLSNYNTEWDAQRMKKGEFPFINEVHAITVDGSKIMAVYKLKK